MHLALAQAFHALKGQASPEVEQAYARAQELCGQIEADPQLFRVLMGLYRFHAGKGHYQKAREIMEQFYIAAQRMQDPDLLLEAHMSCGTILGYGQE